MSKNLQLTYRGQNYERKPSFTQLKQDLDRTNKIQLKYRGQTYEYTPFYFQTSDRLNAIASEFFSANKIQLKYRGQTYEHKSRSI
jgi:Domain of unknown function (DUF4278)